MDRKNIKLTTSFGKFCRKKKKNCPRQDFRKFGEKANKNGERRWEEREKRNDEI